MFSAAEGADIPAGLLADFNLRHPNGNGFMTASCAFVFTVLLILHIEALWAEAILLVQLRVLFILPAGKHHADALIERKVQDLLGETQA